MHNHIVTVASTAFRLETVAALQEASLLPIASNMFYELYTKHMSTCVWIRSNCEDMPHVIATSCTNSMKSNRVQKPIPSSDEYPSCWHVTLASTRDHPSLHTEPHLCWRHTSTTPSNSEGPFSLTSPSLQESASDAVSNKTCDRQPSLPTLYCSSHS